MVALTFQRLAKSTPDDDWSEFDGVAMTEAQYLDLDDREESDLEYVDGRAWCKAVVDKAHGDLTGELAYWFGVYRRTHGGSFGPERRVAMPGKRYQKPDLAVYRAGTPSGNDALPTLAIEVRSRSETMAEQRRKCRRYRAAGVPVVWLVDPVGRSVEVFDEGRDGVALPADGVLETVELPGFRLPLVELFAVLDREGE